MDNTSFSATEACTASPLRIEIDMAPQEPLELDFCALDVYLGEYSPRGLLDGFNHPLSSDTSSITSGNYSNSTAADQSSNESGSDVDMIEDEVLHISRKSKGAKAYRNKRKDEIAYLRDEVQGLQAELKALQFRSTRTRNKRTSDSTALVSSRTQQLWKQVARSQLDRLHRSEAENATLREMVAVQVLEAKNLRRILRRRARIEMMQEMFGAKGLKSLQKDTASNDSRVFQTLLHDVDEMFVEIDNLFATKGMDQLPCSGFSRETNLEIANGVFYEMRQKRELPFDMQSTANAVWECFRLLGLANLQGVGSSSAVFNVHPNIMEEDGDTIRSSFFAVISGVGDLEGTYNEKVVRRYKDSHRSVFICRVVSKPKFKHGNRGAPATSSAQVVLEESADDVNTTVMKVYFSAERETPAAKDDPATVLAFAAWDELVPRIPVDIETILLDNICKASATPA
ncbi:hypothetical protein AM587_10012919 [Phytophthora nicotianae]|uniref:M96 mating-specific protein family n=2 Tax=Phytophthora nicotianae TaxID=4792 RepID=A0A0W8C2Z7_PHYNI|nr:hypothetical protein AM587_10012919 [Phytophthora nicotianae]